MSVFRSRNTSGGCEFLRPIAPFHEEFTLRHDPEKWVPVFGPDHAQKSNGRGEPRPLAEIPVMTAYFAAAFGSGTGLSASDCR